MNKRARLTAESAQSALTSLKGLMAPVETEEDRQIGRVSEVELGRIRPNRNQPRRSTSSGLKEASIEELAENIREHGLLQPIVVKDTGRFYQIVAGERRWRACQLIGMETVPVRIVDPTDVQDELNIALTENLQRKDLDTLDEAQAFRALSQTYQRSLRDIARLSGRSLTHVHGRLQILAFDDVREAVDSGRIGIADAIKLARVTDEGKRKELLASVEDGSIKGGALMRHVKVILGDLNPEELEPRPASAPPPVRLELSDAISMVRELPEELTEDDRTSLYSLAALVADRLGLQIAAPAAERAPAVVDEPLPAILPEVEPETEVYDEPVLSTPESRRVLARIKDARNERGYTLVNLITIYWRLVERQNVSFSPGEWTAVASGDDSYTIRLKYRLDKEPREMVWQYSPADGAVQPLNDEARMVWE